MSSVPSAPARTTVVPRVGVAVRETLAGQLAGYLELAKPRIAVLALVTVTVGYVLGSADALRLMPLLHCLLGVTLVAAGSSALNQFMERDSDAKMRRTADRPLPSGRLRPASVLGFGLTTGIVGCLYLAVSVNGLTALLAAVTLLLYTVVYTPLKRITSLCTAVGAIPGALPPLLGWTASGAPINSGGLSLFVILYVWQFPHFLAIVWLYRDEYAGAGLRMLPAGQPAPRITGIMAVTYALALLPISLLPGRLGLAGDGYLLAAVVLGIGYVVCALRFAWNESAASARGLVYSSLVYLPLLLAALTWNHFQLLSH